MGFFGHSYPSYSHGHTPGHSTSPSARSSPDSNEFERHEIKTYQRKGDQVRSEYERLNPDGTVTKSVAYGNIKEGLKYRSFQLFQDGSVREMAPEQTLPPPPTPPRAVTPPPPPQPPQQQKIDSGKSYTFVVEPKNSSSGNSTWRIRPMSSSQEKKVSTPEPPPREKTSSWWYDSINEAFKEERPKPRAIEEPQYKSSKKNIFDIFDDDFFSMKPKHTFKAPKMADPFQMLENSFEDSFFGDVSKCPFLSSF